MATLFKYNGNVLLDIKIRPFLDRKEQLHLLFQAHIPMYRSYCRFERFLIINFFIIGGAAPLPPGYASAPSSNKRYTVNKYATDTTSVSVKQWKTKWKQYISLVFFHHGNNLLCFEFSYWLPRTQRILIQYSHSKLSFPISKKFFTFSIHMIMLLRNQ